MELVAPPDLLQGPPNSFFNLARSLAQRTQILNAGLYCPVAAQVRPMPFSVRLFKLFWQYEAPWHRSWGSAFGDPPYPASGSPRARRRASTRHKGLDGAGL